MEYNDMSSSNAKRADGFMILPNIIYILHHSTYLHIQYVICMTNTIYNIENNNDPRTHQPTRHVHATLPAPASEAFPVPWCLLRRRCRRFIRKLAGLSHINSHKDNSGYWMNSDLSVLHNFHEFSMFDPYRPLSWHPPGLSTGAIAVMLTSCCDVKRCRCPVV